jgi:hypothetical protein
LNLEVKGIGEGWGTFTYQSLTPIEVKVLMKDPSHFRLHIVKFDGAKIVDHYVVPGDDIVQHFNVQISQYSLSPISQRKLSRFKQPK